MQRRDIRTVLITLVVVGAVLALFMGWQALRREVQPGKEAAAYLDALVKLGKMPPAQQIDAWMREAVAKQDQADQAQAPGGEKK